MSWVGVARALGLCFAISTLAVSCAKSTQAPADTTAPVCTTTGDYVERGEASNHEFAAGAAEASGLTFGAGHSPVTIGGCVGSNQSTPVEADGDFFSFAVDSAVRLRVELTWPEAIATQHTVGVLGRDGSGNNTIAVWWAVGNTGFVSTRPVTLSPGAYRIHVSSANPAPRDPFAYQLRLLEDNQICNPGGVTVVHTEADESGVGHRANDIAFVTWPSFVHVDSTEGLDTAETTGIVLASAETTKFAGSAGSVVPLQDASGVASDYLDSDVFAFTTGPSIEAVSVLLEFSPQGGPPDVDMDVIAFEGLDLGRISGIGAALAVDSDETWISVRPSTDYWIWVGTRDERELGGSTNLPLSYTVTLCGI